MPKKMLSVCVPSLGEVSIHWAVNYGLLACPMNYSILKIFKEGLPVAEGRNLLVKSSLDFAKENDCQLTHIFWIDDDVIFPNQALMHLLTRDTPIVSGVYFGKSDFSQPLIFSGPGEGCMDFVPNGYEPVWSHGMGLTLIRAEVYERMLKELDLGVDSLGSPMWYRTINHEQQKADATESHFMAMTEDFYFCGNAHKLGFQPMIDTTQNAFGWHYDSKAKQGYPRKQFDEFKEKNTATWDTKDGPVVWNYSK